METRDFQDALSAAWCLLPDGEAPADERVRSAAVRYLLDLPEPAGLPGFFPFSVEVGERFNRWKTKTGPHVRRWHRSGRGLDRLDDRTGLLRYSFGTSDPTYRLRWDRDAMRIAVPTTMAIEALVASGLAGHPRVERAVGTLVELQDHPLCRTGADYRCCRAYGRRDLWVPERVGPPDFERATHFPASPGPYFYAPLVRRALRAYPGFAGSELDTQTFGKEVERRVPELP